MTGAASQQLSQWPLLPAAAATIPVAPATPQEYHSSMRTRASIALLLPLACLLGCTLPYTPPASTSTTLNGFWVFTDNGSYPPGAVFLTGAFQSQGSQVSGIFTGGIPCSPQVHNFSGMLEPSGTLDLAAPFAGAQLQVSTDLTSATGSAGGGGNLCLAMLEASSITGTQIATTPSASLTGTFAGSVAESASNITLPIGNASVSLALTQPPTLNPGIQSPLTGSLTFTSTGCTSTIPVTGTLNGFWINLASAPVTGSTPAVSIVAATNPDASQITAGTIVYTPSPCSAVNSSSTTYQGVIARQ